MKIDPLESKYLLKAGQAARAAHRPFTPFPEYEPPAVQVDDLWMAALAIALIAWTL